MKTRNQIIKSLPKPLIKIGLVAEKCIEQLVSEGHTFEKAENIVIEILNDSLPYIEQKMYSSVIATLEMTFLNKSLDEAATDVLNEIEYDNDSLFFELQK